MDNEKEILEQPDVGETEAEEDRPEPQPEALADEQPQDEAAPSSPEEPALETTPDDVTSDDDAPTDEQPVDDAPPAAEEDSAPPEAEAEEDVEAEASEEPAAEAEAPEETTELSEAAVEVPPTEEPVSEAEMEGETPPTEAESPAEEAPAAEAEVPEEAPEEVPPPEAVSEVETEDETEAEAPEAAEVEAPEEAEAEAAEMEAEPTDEEEAAEAAEVEEAEPSDEDLFLQAMSGEVEIEGITAPKKGELVTGTIERITDNEILIDIGAKSEGIIRGREIERLEADVLEGLEVGGEIEVIVVTPEDRQGHTVLSLRRAMEQKDWQHAEELLESKDVYQSKITGFNKGGLIVPFGRVRGFVPASQVGRERRRQGKGSTPEERWGDMVGEEIAVKVLEVDRGRNRLILSERAADRERRAERRAELIDELEVGQRRTGRVVRLTDFGAFVDLGGADGLVHLSELAWRHVDHPKDVLNAGDEIEVEVINLDKERQRIGLSRKNCLRDPWDVVEEDFHAGQLVQGRITKLTKFGAFAALVERPEIEGLIHISELADHRVAHPRDVVSEDEVLTLRILRIEPHRRRMGLSLKQVDSAEYIDDDWQDLVSAASGGE